MHAFHEFLEANKTHKSDNEFLRHLSNFTFFVSETCKERFHKTGMITFLDSIHVLSNPFKTLISILRIARSKAFTKLVYDSFWPNCLAPFID